MTHRSITATLVLLAVLYLLSSCTNQNNMPAPADSIPPIEDHTQQTMAMMQAMNGMIQRMDSMKMTGNFDVDFANMMIEHHQGAINMSKTELKYSSDAQLKDMAQKIIAAQQAENAKLQAFVQAHPALSVQEQPMHGENMRAMHGQMQDMHMSGKVDQDFASMMIMHHQDAVTMAREELAKGQHTEMKQMAQQMIDVQQREIAEFQAWLDKNRK